MLRPVVLYGAESWALNQAKENKLAIFERKVLRRIFGPVQESGNWRTRFNHELKTLYHEPDIVAVAKSNRLRWAGHVLRMDDSEMVKKIFKVTSYISNRRGRPRVTWKQNMEEDLGILRASKNYETAA